MSYPKTLYLIDAYALIFRGYYAFIKNPRINSKGMDTSAIMGFTNSLFDLIKRENPKNLAVCFDKGGSKTRKEIYQEYKSNRLETPEAIASFLKFINHLSKVWSLLKKFEKMKIFKEIINKNIFDISLNIIFAIY